MSKDYIPSNNNDFMLFQQNLDTEVAANATPWNIPASEATALNTWSTGYTPLYTAISNRRTRTQEQVIAHDEYRADYVAFLRPFCQGFLVNNTLIPISERAALGLNPRGLNPRSERPDILTAPIPSLKPLGGGMVRFTFKVENSTKRVARHPYSNGVEVYFQLVAPGQKPEELELEELQQEKEDSKFDKMFNTRAQFVQQMDLQYVGYTLYVYAKWVNTSDPKKDGPYSGTVSMVIS